MKSIGSVLSPRGTGRRRGPIVQGPIVQGPIVQVPIVRRSGAAVDGDEGRAPEECLQLVAGARRRRDRRRPGSRIRTGDDPVALPELVEAAARTEAIEHLRGSRMVGYLARTHLVHGEWLRREGHRQAARDQLRPAHEQLSAMGARAFAERAARELRATGEHPRARSARRTDALTAQELHIARMVSTGATSRRQLEDLESP